MAKPQYQITEIPGEEYRTLEQCQNAIFAQLVRLLIEAIQERELSGSGETEQKQPLAEVKEGV